MFKTLSGPFKDLPTDPLRIADPLYKKNPKISANIF